MNRSIVLALALVPATLLLSQTALAEEKAEAPNNVLSFSAVWPDLHENPAGGQLSAGYRFNLYNETLLLEWTYLSLGGFYSHPSLAPNDWKIMANANMKLGPTLAITKYFELGAHVGPAGYLYGYIPQMSENANGYALGSYGAVGQLVARAGIGPIFLGLAYEVNKPFGGQPGDLKPAVAVDTTNVNVANPNNTNANDVVDTSNLGKVDRVDGEAFSTVHATLGFRW